MNKPEAIEKLVKKHSLLREIEPFSGSKNKKAGDYWIHQIKNILRIDFAPVGGNGEISRFDYIILK